VANRVVGLQAQRGTKFGPSLFKLAGRIMPLSALKRESRSPSRDESRLHHVWEDRRERCQENEGNPTPHPEALMQ
jgi:hypothetical protein